MAQRIIKNYTNEDFIVKDLGDLTLPMQGAVDIGGDEYRLIQLASSNDLLSALGQGSDKFQVNDGIKDLSFSEGIELIKKLQPIPQRDSQGRWIIKTDSRPTNWDIVFSGCGDDVANGKIWGGTPFKWDFSTEDGFIEAPAGFKRKRINWMFIDAVYMKEGAIYYYNAPKGSYIDFSIYCPTGGWFDRKTINQDGTITRSFHQATKETKWVHWVSNLWIEGSCPMGDELNTGATTDSPSPNYTIWRAEITVPETTGWEDFHGHFALEFYRARTVLPTEQ